MAAGTAYGMKLDGTMEAEILGTRVSWHTAGSSVWVPRSAALVRNRIQKCRWPCDVCVYLTRHQLGSGGANEDGTKSLAVFVACRDVVFAARRSVIPDLESLKVNPIRQSCQIFWYQFTRVVLDKGPLNGCCRL